MASYWSVFVVVVVVVAQNDDVFDKRGRERQKCISSSDTKERAYDQDKRVTAVKTHLHILCSAYICCTAVHFKTLLWLTNLRPNQDKVFENPP